MKLHSNVYEVKTVCCLKTRLFAFPQFLSYCFPTSLLHAITRLPYGNITSIKVLLFYAFVQLYRWGTLVKWLNGRILLCGALVIYAGLSQLWIRFTLCNEVSSRYSIRLPSYGMHKDNMKKKKKKKKPYSKGSNSETKKGRAIIFVRNTPT